VLGCWVVGVLGWWGGGVFGRWVVEVPDPLFAGLSEFDGQCFDGFPCLELGVEG